LQSLWLKHLLAIINLILVIVLLGIVAFYMAGCATPPPTIPVYPYVGPLTNPDGTLINPPSYQELPR
jgi:hypothetical protein